MGITPNRVVEDNFFEGKRRGGSSNREYAGMIPVMPADWLHLSIGLRKEVFEPERGGLVGASLRACLQLQKGFFLPDLPRRCCSFCSRLSGKDYVRRQSL